MQSRSNRDILISGPGGVPPFRSVLQDLRQVRHVVDVGHGQFFVPRMYFTPSRGGGRHERHRRVTLVGDEAWSPRLRPLLVKFLAGAAETLFWLAPAPGCLPQQWRIYYQRFSLS